MNNNNTPLRILDENQEILRDRREAINLGNDLGEVALLQLDVVIIQQGFAHGSDDRHWGAHLVRDIGDEVGANAF